MAEPGTEETQMGWYRVCLNTIVRKDVKLDSERLRILPMGSRVNVVQKEGRRVMIDQPIKGWCSLSSSNGDTILKPLSEDTASQTPRNNPAEQAAHYKKEANKAKDQSKGTQDEKEKAALLEKAAKYDALSAQVLSQQEAHEKEMKSLTAAASSTNVENMVFRDGDVVQLTAKNHERGLVVVRAVVRLGETEWIGCDYDNAATPYFPSEPFGTHPDTGSTVHFKSGDGMKPGWVRRNDVTGYLAGGSVINQLNEQVLKNSILESMLDAIKKIVKELDKDPKLPQYNGLTAIIMEKATKYAMKE